MKLAFSMPHIMEVPAITTPWERQVTGPEMAALARWAEQLGFVMIPVSEHFLIPQEHVARSGAFYLAAYPSMAFLAGATETIRVNSSIALLPMQNPVIAAKTLSTMDWLSNGRVTATFGVGWLKGEFEALGIDFHQRGAMAEEYIQAMIALWTEERPEFEGRYVNFRDVAFEPKCIQTPHIKVWFGGEKDPVLRRVARYGCGWWPNRVPAEKIPERIDFIKSQPDYNGKLEDICYGFSSSRVGDNHVATNNPIGRPGQSKLEIIERLGWFADLGVTISSISIPEMRGIAEYRDYTQWISEEIMPAIA
jgi:probable F420-dependent oxidoreductase